MREIWKNIPNFQDYEASNLGNIRKINFRNFGITKQLKQNYDKNGYKKVNLNKKSYIAHRIIAMTFLKEYNEKLEMMTSKENSQHRTNVLKVGKIKPVVMINKNKKIINIFNSTREAERKTKINHTSISRVCKKIKNTAGGYYWEYLKKD